MLIRKVREIFEKSEIEMKKMNQAFEERKKANAIRSAEIKSSIQRKSEEFQARKQTRDETFKAIRS
jgi:hypothetical protein